MLYNLFQIYSTKSQSTYFNYYLIIMLRFIKYSISNTNKILFMGSDNFAYHPLAALHKNFTNIQVVTHYTKPGIKSENKVSNYCLKQNIPCSSPIHKASKQQRIQQWKQYQEKIKNKQYDLGVICSYGYMIPQKIIKLFKYGMLVVHPSLLPKYRGGAPIFHAIANGDQQSGVSYIQISQGKFDAGNILYQTKINLPSDKSYVDIEDLLSQNAAQKLPFVIQNLEQLRPGVPQSQNQKSGAPIITQKFLDLNLPTKRVYNLSRAMKAPRVRFEDRQLILKLSQQYSPISQGYQVGTVFKKGRKKVFVVCGDGLAVRMDQYKQPSKHFYGATTFIDRYLKDKDLVKFA